MKTFFTGLFGVIVTIVGAISLIALWIFNVIAKNIGIIIAALIMAVILIKTFGGAS